MPEPENPTSSRRKTMISTKARKDALITPKRLRNSEIVRFQDPNCGNIQQISQNTEKLLKRHFSMIDDE